MELRRSARITAQWLKEQQLEASLNNDWTEYEKEEKLKDAMAEQIAKTQKEQAEKNKRDGMDQPAVFIQAPPPQPKNRSQPSGFHPHAGNDNFNTPAAAWDLAAKYLVKNDETVWQPFYNDGAITSKFKNSIHVKKDFFAYEPEQYDFTIDNPPYSTKQEVIERLFKLGKPFALLIPASTMLRVWFYKLKPSSRDLTIIIPKSNYVFKGKEKSIRVETAWFCFGFNLGREMIYEGEDLMAE